MIVVRLRDVVRQRVFGNVIGNIPEQKQGRQRKQNHRGEKPAADFAKAQAGSKFTKEAGQARYPPK